MTLPCLDFKSPFDSLSKLLITSGLALELLKILDYPYIRLLRGIVTLAQMSPGTALSGCPDLSDPHHLRPCLSDLLQTQSDIAKRNLKTQTKAAKDRNQEEASKMRSWPRRSLRPQSPPNGHPFGSSQHAVWFPGPDDGSPPAPPNRPPISPGYMSKAYPIAGTYI